MPNSLSRFVQKFDIYSIGVQLNFQKKEKQKSFFGGIISFISFIFIGYTFWFYSNIILQRQNPQVVQSLKEVIQSEKIYVNKDNIVVMVGVQNQASQSFKDPSVFQISAMFQELVQSQDPISGLPNKKLVTSSIDVKECSTEDVSKQKLKDYFSKFNYHNYYCLNNTNSERNYIQGGFDQNFFTQIFFAVKKCQNSTLPDSVICKSPEEIDKILASTKISINFSDQLVDPTSLENPFVDKGINQYSQISSKFQKEIQILYSNSYIDDDIGYMTKEVIHKKGYSFSDLREMLVNDSPEVLCRVLIRIRRSKENYMTRRYPKVFDAAAQIGGLIKIITMIGALLARNFQRFEFHRRLVNEIFSFQSEKQMISAVDKQLNRERTVSVENSMNDIFRLPEKAGSKSPDKLASISMNRERVNSTNLRRKGNFMKQVQQIFTVTKDEMKYKICDYFSHFLCPRAQSIEKKKPMLDYSIQKVMDNLDILFILNKLIEIDKLKYILFDEDQLKLFEFIPKPVITMYDAKNSFENPISQSISNNLSTHAQGRSFKISSCGKKQSKPPKFFFEADKSQGQKAADGQKSLMQVLSKQNKSVIDQKLLNAINPNLLNYKGQNQPQSKYSMNNLQIGDKKFNFSQIEISPLNQIQEDSVIPNKKEFSKDTFNSVEMCRARDDTNNNMTITISPPQNNFELSTYVSPQIDPVIQINESDVKENDLTSITNQSLDNTKAQINKIKFNSSMFFDKFKEIQGLNRIDISEEYIIDSKNSNY